MRLGANKFALMAQFGTLAQMKVGLEYERRHASTQAVLNHLDPAKRVSTIEFSWRKYESRDHQLFFYRFRFRSADDKVVGTIQNLSKKLLRTLATNKAFKLLQRRKDFTCLEDDEYIAAVKLGLRDSFSLVNV